ncbi:MAG: hypothetical protein BLITH_1554 [Brockia lithotrophica]|uniref:UPF0297 protein BLITH_1554 n=1 Tax=Brockia lithotrophica TaxID=933949 RepID=A0A2T5G5M1_9BACL|nr:IreB family regulatory phosphoprotein [Brockia lithotrophica]PTQ51477.1 MAG: hypothetical protein BLITH_1554 [Brockia lithotrophica]
MEPTDETRTFSWGDGGEAGLVRDILTDVYAALEEKGYDPVGQLVGYLLTGEPAYIPRHRQARNLIRKIPRDRLLEFLVRDYLAREVYPRLAPPAGKASPDEGREPSVPGEGT